MISSRSGEPEASDLLDLEREQGVADCDLERGRVRGDADLRLELAAAPRPGEAAGLDLPRSSLELPALPAGAAGLTADASMRCSTSK